MKIPPKTWAVCGGAVLSLVVVGRIATGCGNPGGFKIEPAQGTEFRLTTYSDSAMEFSGGAVTQNVSLKMSLEQRLKFVTPPGPTQNLEIVTDSCFIDSGEQKVLPVDGVEEAMRAFKVTMAIRPNGEPVSISPHITGTYSPLAENVISSQLTSLQAAGPLGYSLKSSRPAVGESWTVASDLTDAVRQSTADFVTPIEASAEYTYTYLGDMKFDGKNLGYPERDGADVLHFKRVGSGRIRQTVNVQGMPNKETETEMSSDGDVYVDAGTGLLVFLKSLDNAVIDFGALKVKQSTQVTVKGSRAF